MNNNFAKGFNNQKDVKIVSNVVIRNDKLDNIRENMYIMKKVEIKKPEEKIVEQINHSTQKFKNIRGK